MDTHASFDVASYPSITPYSHEHCDSQIIVEHLISLGHPHPDEGLPVKALRSALALGLHLDLPCGVTEFDCGRPIFDVNLPR